MAENAIIKPISKEEVAKNQIEGNLPDKPSQATLYGGKVLRPQEIKAWYDKLPKLIVEYYNSLIKAIPGIEDGKISDNSLAAQILTGIREGHSLKDLLEDITSGALADYLHVTQDITLIDLTKALLNQINAWGEDAPTADTQGELGNLYAVINQGEITSLYMCTGKTEEQTYWTKFKKEIPEITASDNGKILTVENGKVGVSSEIPNRTAELEQAVKVLMPPRLAADGALILVDSIPTEASRIEFYDGDYLIEYAETGGATQLYFEAPKDGKDHIIYVRVLADGWKPSSFSNSILYSSKPDFVSGRASTARVYFPFKTFPLYDINHNVMIAWLDHFRDDAIGHPSENEGRHGYPCMVYEGKDTAWWSKAARFTRSHCEVASSEDFGTFYEDELVTDPFPNPYESTIEMWICPTTIASIDDWGNHGAAIFESTSGPNKPFFKFAYGRAWEGDRSLLRVDVDDMANGKRVKFYDIGDITNGTWNHIVVTQKTVNGNTDTIVYSNGRRCNEYLPPYQFGEYNAGALHSFYKCQTATAAYSIGCACGGPDHCLNGKVDLFAIYDYTWTEYQARSVYEREKE